MYALIKLGWGLLKSIKNETLKLEVSYLQNLKLHSLNENKQRKLTCFFSFIVKYHACKGYLMSVFPF